MTTMTTVSRFHTAIAIALVGTASSFAVMPAVADDSDPPRATVKYGDLNIARAEGAAVLYSRIRRAAMNVCLQFDGDRLDIHGQKEACINKAILGAVTKVDAPALAAVYSAKTGKDIPTRLASR